MGADEIALEELKNYIEKYPFLKEIISQESYPIFKIEESTEVESVLAQKCNEHGSEGPEAFDETVYSITGDDIRKLGISAKFMSGEIKYKDPSPTVEEELSYQNLKPEFLVKARHLQYEVKFEHHHDVTLTV